MKSRRAALPSSSSALNWVSGLRLDSQEKSRGWVHSTTMHCHPAGADGMGRAQPSPSRDSCVPALSTALPSGALKLLLCQEAEQWGWGSSVLRALPAPPACPPPRAPLGGLPCLGYQGAISLRDGHLRSQLWALPSKELGAGDVIPWPILEAFTGDTASQSTSEGQSRGLRDQSSTYSPRWGKGPWSPTKSLLSKELSVLFSEKSQPTGQSNPSQGWFPQTHTHPHFPWGGRPRVV